MNTSSCEDKEKPLSFEICFLQDMHEILNRLESGRDIENLSHKVIELKEKIQQAKQEIEETKGIDNTKEKQEAILKCLQNQLQIKRNIVRKYKNFSIVSQNT